MLLGMTRPKRPGADSSSRKGSRGRSQQSRRNQPQGRDGATRDSSKPARAPADARRSEGSPARTDAGASSAARTGPSKTSPGKTGPAKSGAGKAGPANPARQRGAGAGLRGEGFQFSSASGRKAAPRGLKKPLPQLKRVQLEAPAPGTVFHDRDGEPVTFPESNLKRVAADLLSRRDKAWRYRPFAFPLFTDRGHEQSFSFDFYIYDAEDSVIRLILVVPSESREVWDRVGRFKRQYPMYTYELWTPEKLAQLQGPRARWEW